MKRDRDRGNFYQHVQRRFRRAFSAAMFRKAPFTWALFAWAHPVLTRAAFSAMWGPMVIAMDEVYQIERGLTARNDKSPPPP